MYNNFITPLFMSLHKLQIFVPIQHYIKNCQTKQAQPRHLIFMFVEQN